MESMRVSAALLHCDLIREVKILQWGNHDGCGRHLQGNEQA